MQTDREYFMLRAAQELEAARRASCVVREVHTEMAELYALKVGMDDLGTPETPLWH